MGFEGWEGGVGAVRWKFFVLGGGGVSVGTKLINLR